MALTQFPFETNQPIVQVTLPVGRHVLELVVEDSAGLVSAPDQVVITVQAQEAPKPTITGISATNGQQGATVAANITGTNLAEATAVTFSGAGITAAIVSATASSVRVNITIAASAATGTRSFSATTPAGTAQSPSGVTFTVAAAPAQPVITAIEPDTGLAGATVEATIIGENLQKASAVTFFQVSIGKAGAIVEDPNIKVKILDTTDNKVAVAIRILSDAVAGARGFTVELPGGAVQSWDPNKVFFTVNKIILPTIEPTILPTINPGIFATINPTINATISPTILPTFHPFEASGRPVTEVRGIGPALAAKLEAAGVADLAALAALEPAQVAQALGVSEVRAMAFVDEARRLLPG